MAEVPWRAREDRPALAVLESRAELSERVRQPGAAGLIEERVTREGDWCVCRGMNASLSRNVDSGLDRRVAVGFLRKHWLTVTTLLMVAFIGFLALMLSVSDPDPGDDFRVLGVVVLGTCGLVLLGGMWLLREGRSTPVAYTLIVGVTLFVGVGFFWMFFVPTVLAVVIIFFGVVRGGLVRELRPSPAVPPAAA